MNAFYEIMQKHNDERLLEIVERKRADYQPEAIAAAEQVLSERKISWKLPEEKIETVKKISAQDVRKQINEGLQTGQNINMIKDKLRDQGVDVFDYAEADLNEAEENDPVLKKARARRTVAIMGIVFLVFVASKSHRLISDAPDWMLMSTIVVFFAALIFAVYQLVRK
jgi:hypothetical protein